MKMKLGFIGAGMMASALAHGVRKNNLLNGADIMMYDVNADKLTKLQAEVGIVPAKSAEEVFQNCASVIIAVKPQHLATVGYSAGENKPLIISIMAGVTIQALEEKFAASPIVRVMPNNPAQIGEAMSAYCINEAVTAQDKKWVEEILAAVGETAFVNETQMDAVCGLSGSAPAFMYAVIEALADGGVMMGLSRDIAYKLAAQTMKGSAEMALKTGKHPGELKDMVTSPGGTTIKGMYALEKMGLRAALMSAVEEATLQSKKLGEMK